MYPSALTIVCAALLTAPAGAEAPGPEARVCVIHAAQVEGLDEQALGDALLIEGRKAGLKLVVSQVVTMRQCPTPTGDELVHLLRIQDADTIFFVDGSPELNVLSVGGAVAIDRSQSLARQVVQGIATRPGEAPVAPAAADGRDARDARAAKNAPVESVPSVVSTDTAEAPAPRQPRPAASLDTPLRVAEADPWYDNPLGWVGVGVGASGLLLGAIEQSRADEKRAQAICVEEAFCEPFDERVALASEASAHRTRATVGFVVGAAGLATGVAAFVIAAVESDASEEGVRVLAITPTVAADGAPGVASVLSF